MSQPDDTDLPSPEHYTPLQRRNKEREELEAALAEFRKDRAANPPDTELAAAMTGVGEEPAWIEEILHLMDQAIYATLSTLCKMVGTNRMNLMKWRRKTPRLEAYCRDYLAATFEDEMELPHRQIRPGIITLVAERIIPTFSKDADGKLSEEDVALLARSILDSLRTRVAASNIAPDEQQILLQGVAGDIRHTFAKRRTE